MMPKRDVRCKQFNNSKTQYYYRQKIYTPKVHKYFCDDYTARDNLKNFTWILIIYVINIHASINIYIYIYIYIFIDACI